MTKVVLALLLLVSVARAETFAVDLASMDSSSDKLTFGVIDKLRVSGTKKSTLRGKTGKKELVAAKQSIDCVYSKPACAARLGEALGVDYFLTGTVDRHATRVVFSIAMINVSTGKTIRTIREVVDAKASAATVAQRIYKRLIDDATGELVITTAARRGSLLIDGQPVTELYEGRAVLEGLARGSHQLSVRAPGYKPLDMDVTVDGRTELSLLLEPATP